RNYTLCPIGCNFLLDGAHFGESLAWGNFNGDKFSGVIPVADLAIGIPHYTFSSIVATIPNQGAVFVLFGTTGSGLLGGTLIDIVTASDASDLFGAALAAGDFNGDGFSDLAVGAPGEDFGSVINVGIVHVLYGTSSVAAGLSLNRNQFFLASTLGETDEGGAQFGKTLAAGDFNGDGKADLAIGVPLKDVAGVSD